MHNNNNPSKAFYYYVFKQICLSYTHGKNINHHNVPLSETNFY